MHRRNPSKFVLASIWHFCPACCGRICGCTHPLELLCSSSWGCVQFSPTALALHSSGGALPSLRDATACRMSTPEPPAPSGGGTAAVRSWAPATGTALEQRLAAQKARRAQQRSAREPERRRRPPPPKPPPRPRGPDETEQNDLDFGKGAKLLRLCGWTDGEGVGKNKQGVSIDAVLDATAAALGAADRRGLGHARGLGGWTTAAADPSLAAGWAPATPSVATPPDPKASGWGALPAPAPAAAIQSLEPQSVGWSRTSAEPPGPQTSGWEAAKRPHVDAPEVMASRAFSPEDFGIKSFAEVMAEKRGATAPAAPAPAPACSGWGPPPSDAGRRRRSRSPPRRRSRDESPRRRYPSRSPPRRYRSRSPHRLRGDRRPRDCSQRRDR